MWSKVFCGLQIEDETRAFTVGVGTAVESITRAVIKAEETKETSGEKPWNLCKRGNKYGLASVLDNCLNVFDHDINKLSLSLALPLKIEELEWSFDGSFIYLGLEGGMLSALHLASGTIIWLSSKLLEEFSGGKKFFSKILSRCTNTHMDIIVVTTTHKIIRIYGDCYDDLRHCCDDVSLDKLNQKTKLALIVSSSVGVEVICSGPSFQCSGEARAETVVAESPESDFLVLFTGGLLEVWYFTENQLELLNSCLIGTVVVKAFITPDMRCIVCKMEEDFLLILDLESLHPDYLLKGNLITDISFVYSEDESSPKLALIKEKSDSFQLCSYVYPGFDLEFTLSNLEDCSLPIGLTNTVYYFEYLGTDSINSVNIKAVDKIDPEKRLKRLLEKEKFEEAEQFCHDFNLSKADIYRCKALKLVGEISINNKGRLTENEIDIIFKSLIVALDNIEDVCFVVDLCVNTIPSTLELIEKLLLYATSRLDKMNHLDLVNKVALAQKLFEKSKLWRTFTLLKNVDHSPASWSTFSSSNFFKDCQTYVSKGDISSAVLLCKCHWNKIKMMLNPMSAKTLLTLLPHTLPQSDLFLWLETFIPLYLSLASDSFMYFNQWIIDIIGLYANTNHNVELCRQILSEILSVLQTKLPYGICAVSCSLTVNYIAETIMIMDRLISLKQEYHITVPFDYLPLNHSKEDKSIMLINMLKKIHYNDFEIFINYFVEPFCLEHSIRRDSILLEYLKNLSKLPGDSWEAQCTKIIEFIIKKSDKMFAMLYILKAARMPWSEAISSLEEQCYKAATPDMKRSILHLRKSSFIYSKLVKYSLSPTITPDKIDFTQALYLMEVIISRSSFENPEELLNDIKQLEPIIECRQTMITAFSYFIESSLSRGKTEEALTLLEREVSEEDVEMVYQICLSFVTSSHMWSRYSSNEKIENVKALISRLVQKLPKEYLPSNLFEIIILLKDEYGIEVNVSSGMSEEDRLSLASTCVQQLVNNEGTVESFGLERLKRLTAKLKLPISTICMYLVHQAFAVNNLDMVSFYLQFLASDSCSCNTIEADRVYDLALKIFKSNSSVKHLYKDLSRLMHSVSLKNCSSYRLSFFNKMVVCDMLIELVERQEFVQPHWYRGFFLSDVVCQDQEIPQQMISSLASMLTEDTLKPTQSFLAEFLNHLPQSIYTTSIAIRLCLAFEKLNVEVPFISDADIQRIRNLVTHRVSSCLIKSVFSNAFDWLTSLNLLSYFSPDNASKWLNNIWLQTQEHRVFNLLQLGLAYCAHHNLTEATDYSGFLAVFLWNRKFESQRISFEEICDSESLKVATLNKLMLLPNFNCDLLQLFCTVFQSDYQTNLLIYLKMLLTSWKLEYTIVDNEFIPKNNCENLSKTCRTIVNNIRMPKQQLANILFQNSILAEINPYHYEVYSFLFDLIIELDPSNQSLKLVSYKVLLDFLLAYKRISMPGRVELDMWERENDETKVNEMQAISKFRLPFRELPLEDQYSFIAPEFTLDNYEQWLKLPTWLGFSLSVDLICVQTIRNLKRDSSETQGWDLHLKRQDLISKILKCVNYIEDLEFAASSLYHSVNNAIPPGADQVELAQQCLLKATVWREVSNCKKSRILLAKAEKKYLNIKIEHILRRHNLAKSEYMSLINEPIKLCRALYSDPSILNNSSWPGVNEACRIIASSNKLEQQLLQVKTDLLFEWLEMNSVGNQLPHQSNAELAEHSEHVKRAVYMLMGEENESFIDILRTGLLPSNEPAKPIQVNLRSVQTVLCTIPREQLYSTTGYTYEQLMLFKENCQFIYDLKLAGISLSMNEFISLPKDNIILNLLENPSLWRCSVAANLALTYDFKVASIWNKIISYFLLNDQLPQLEKYLICINEWCRSILDLNVLVSAWKSVLVHHQKNEDKNAVRKVYFSCPVLDMLQFEPSEYNLF